MPNFVNSMPPVGGGMNFSGGLRDSYGTPVANPTPSTTPYTPSPAASMPGLGQPSQSMAMQQRTSAPMGQGSIASGLGTNLAHPMPGYTGVGNDNPMTRSSAPTLAPTGNTGSVSGVSTGASQGYQSPSAPPRGLGQPSTSPTPTHFNNISGGPGGGSMSPGPVSAPPSSSPGSSPAASSGWSGFTPPASPPAGLGMSQPAMRGDGGAGGGAGNGNSYQTQYMTNAASGVPIDKPNGVPGGQPYGDSNSPFQTGANGQSNWQNWGWSSPQGNNAGAFTPFAPGGSQGNMGMQGGPGPQAPQQDPLSNPTNYGLGYGGGPAITQAQRPNRIMA